MRSGDQPQTTPEGKQTMITIQDLIVEIDTDASVERFYGPALTSLGSIGDDDALLRRGDKALVIGVESDDDGEYFTFTAYEADGDDWTDMETGGGPIAEAPAKLSREYGWLTA